MHIVVKFLKFISLFLSAVKRTYNELIAKNEICTCAGHHSRPAILHNNISVISHQLPAHNTNNIRTNTSPAGSRLPQQPNFTRDNYFSSSIHPVINDSDNVAAKSDEITLDKSDLNVVNDIFDDRLGSSHDVLSNGDQYFENLSESDIFRMSETQANAFKKGAKIELSKAPSADYDADDVIRPKVRRDATFSRRQAKPTERKKTTCMLYLQVNTFYQDCRSSK